MPTATVNDLDIYYEAHGSGPPLLYLGGAQANLRASSFATNPMVEHFRVLAFDQRGQGQTSKPDIPYTIAMFSDDAAGLMDATGFGPAVVMGVSFGGMVAQELAIRHPSKVRFLVLCCSGSGGEGGRSADFRAILDNPNRSQEENIKAFFGLQDSRRGPEWMATHPDEARSLVEQYRSGQERNPPDPVGWSRLYAARQSHDTYDRLGQIRAPTLVLGGRYDGQAPPQNQERLATAIPGAKTFFFEGGHGFLGQDSEAAYGTIIGEVLEHLAAGA